MATLAKDKDGTLTLTIPVAWKDIQSAYEKAVDEAVNTANIQGFREGKAPRAMVEKQLDRTKTYESAIKTLIPKLYDEAVKTLNIRPVVLPHIELKDAQEGKDWMVEAVTCEKPTVDLKEYKKALGDFNTAKKNKIWVPGADDKNSDKKKEESKPSMDEIFTELLKHVSITLPHILITEEVNRMLSDLIDQTKRLGMTVEQYLSSTGKTSESLREEYRNQAVRSLSLEFILDAVANSESLTVSQDDIDKALSEVKSEKEREDLKKQSYYVASVLRRRKTLDFLASL